MSKPNKTQPTTQSVESFLQTVVDLQRRADGFAMLQMMGEETGVAPQMWGSSMIGFGTEHYKYASGREGDCMVVGFSPRKQALTLYGLVYYKDRREEAAKLGPVTMGKGCLYIKRLTDVDEPLLRRMIRESFQRNTEQSL